LELGEWEVRIKLQLEVDCMAIVKLSIWSHGNLVAITAISAGLVVAASTCGSIGAGLLIPEEGLAQADGGCTVLDVNIDVGWHWNSNAAQWGQWQWCIYRWNLGNCRVERCELSCNRNSGKSKDGYPLGSRFGCNNTILIHLTCLLTPKDAS
jgi:hypothetical protein